MTPRLIRQVDPASRTFSSDPQGRAPDDWAEEAVTRLLGLRTGSMGWGYRAGTEPGVEPTSLASLSFLAADPDRGRGLAAAKAAAEWLAMIQNPDGSLGVSLKIPAPGWTTPYAVLLWKALASHKPQTDTAMRWLLGQKGIAIARGADDVAGHDTTIIGWPWVAETHSWVEPTALALLALRSDGQSDHPRACEGRRLILDRAIVTGGWNYGNKSVFGRDLRAHPAPTGLALLALAGGERSEIIVRAIAYLEATLPGVRSAPSLGWGLLGLRAWGHRPTPAIGWLAESCRRILRPTITSSQLAYLLLASAEPALKLLGIDDAKEAQDV